MPNRIVLALGSIPALLFPLFAQQSGVPLPPDDPRLFVVFFRFHDEVSSAIQLKKATDPITGAKAEKGYAQKLRIKKEELQSVTDIAHRLVQDLAKWHDDLKAYVDRARSQKQQPDSSILRQFEERRQQLIDNSIHLTSTSLSPSSWAGLRGYINDEHRPHTKLIQVGQASTSPPK